MLQVVSNEKEYLEECAKVYIQAYREEPWQEEYELSEVECYIDKFGQAETRHCFILKEDETVIGLALAVVMPGVGSDYLRIEDFCIAPRKQKCGMGSTFIRMIREQLPALACDSILLGTQKDFPSHKFYVKNGFKEVPDAVLLYGE